MLTNITFVSFCIFSKLRRLETFCCFPGVLIFFCVPPQEGSGSGLRWKRPSKCCSTTSLCRRHILRH